MENPYSCSPYGEPLQLQSLWRAPTAAVPMDKPYCSCMLTRVLDTQTRWADAITQRWLNLRFDIMAPKR